MIHSVKNMLKQAEFTSRECTDVRHIVFFFFQHLLINIQSSEAGNIDNLLFFGRFWAYLQKDRVFVPRENAFSEPGVKLNITLMSIVIALKLFEIDLNFFHGGGAFIA